MLDTSSGRPGTAFIRSGDSTSTVPIFELSESLAAGPAGRQARGALAERLARLFEPALAELRPADPNPALVARATIGGIFELIYGPLARHDLDALRDLAEQIGELPLVLPPEARA